MKNDKAGRNYGLMQDGKFVGYKLTKDEVLALKEKLQKESPASVFMFAKAERTDVRKMFKEGGNTIRISKEPFMASFSGLYDKDLKVEKVYPYKFASGSKNYYVVEFEGKQYDIPEDLVIKLKNGGSTHAIKHPKASQAPADIWKYMLRKAGDWAEAPSIPSRLVKENKAYFDALPVFNFDFILDDYYPDYNYPYDPFPDSLQINVNGDPFIAVVGERSYYIDPQGYEYARYIGEIDGYEKDERAIVIMGKGGNTAKGWEYTIGGL